TTLDITAWIVLAAFFFPAGSALAQGKDSAAQEGQGQKPEKKAKKKKDQAAPKKEKTAAEGQAAPGQDPAAMAAMMKAISPGENHKALEPLAGNWETAATFTMGPGLPTMQSKGGCKRHWVLGGRFLQEEVTGEMMGMPFEGL